jgi:endonuclease/exonuclease/phosphatase family metal-dependent hydrolase
MTNTWVIGAATIRRLLCGVLFVLLGAGLFAETVHSAAVELKVMSFNIRFARVGHSEERPENNWTDAKSPRRERVVRVIRDYMPDVLGVQEARNGQIVDLQKALPEYGFYGVGRDNGKRGGEYTGIYYRKDKFVLLGEDSFWLSDSPETPGSKFDKAPLALTRMASWVRLRDKTSGATFLVLNTHWDHISKVARRLSAALILDRIVKHGGDSAAIVMGDLNAPETSRELKTLLQGERALVDSYRVLFPTPSADEGSFGGWEGKRDGHRIDFILHTKQFKPIAAEVMRTNYDGLWPSDHYPVTATLRLQSAK